MKSLFQRMTLILGAEKMLSPKITNGLAKVNNSHKTRDIELEHIARKAVERHDYGLSQVVTVGWNSRMRTSAGVAIPSRWEIWLNPSLLDISRKEVERTLLHELAHLLAHRRNRLRRLAPHGSEGLEACRDLGIPGEERTHQLPFKRRKMKPRYRLCCPACGACHERVRRPRSKVACLNCCRLHYGGRYHQRFCFNISTIGSDLEDHPSAVTSSNQEYQRND